MRSAIADAQAKTSEEVDYTNVSHARDFRARGAALPLIRAGGIRREAMRERRTDPQENAAVAS